ncbi:MAG: hypothetical protein AAF713_19865 [Pseudomonadota bacterium]
MRWIVAGLIVMLVGLSNMFLNIGLERRSSGFGAVHLPSVLPSPVPADLGLLAALRPDRFLQAGEESGGIRVERRGTGLAILSETTEIRVKTPTGHTLDPRVAVIREDAGAVMLEDSQGVRTIAVYVDMRQPVEPQSFSDKGRIYAQVERQVRRKGEVSGIGRGLGLQKASSDASGAYFCGETEAMPGRTLWFGYRLSGRLAVMAAFESDCRTGHRAVRQRLSKAVQAYAGNR